MITWHDHIQCFSTDTKTVPVIFGDLTAAYKYAKWDGKGEPDITTARDTKNVIICKGVALGIRHQTTASGTDCYNFHYSVHTSAKSKRIRSTLGMGDTFEAGWHRLLLRLLELEAIHPAAIIHFDTYKPSKARLRAHIKAYCAEHHLDPTLLLHDIEILLPDVRYRKQVGRL